jgi:opacity protein-like surface antigen
MPVPTARGKEFDASVGYQSLSLDMPPMGWSYLSGIDASMTMRFVPRVGIKADIGYARTLNWLSSGVTATAFDYLGGPVVDLTRNRHISTYAQFLVGGAKLTGPVPFEGVIGKGLVNNVAFDVGFGVQYSISESIAARVEANYLHTKFYNPSLTLSGEGNFRAVTSIVYCFGKTRR